MAYGAVDEVLSDHGCDSEPRRLISRADVQVREVDESRTKQRRMMVCACLHMYNESTAGLGSSRAGRTSLGFWHKAELG